MKYKLQVLKKRNEAFSLCRNINFLKILFYNFKGHDVRYSLDEEKSILDRGDSGSVFLEKDSGEGFVFDFFIKHLNINDCSIIYQIEDIGRFHNDEIEADSSGFDRFVDSMEIMICISGDCDESNQSRKSIITLQDKIIFKSKIISYLYSIFGFFTWVKWRVLFKSHGEETINNEYVCK